MSERPTPETDALSFRFIDGAGVECEAVPSEFVRLLERERDAAREAYEIISSKWQKTDEQLAKTLRERDGALRQCTNFEEIIRGEWPKDQADELIRYAKEGAK